MISQRTIAGLAAAKARGRKLGSSGKVLAAKNAADAAARDEALRPVLVSMAGQSSRAIAAALTEQGIEPPRGRYVVTEDRAAHDGAARAEGLDVPPLRSVDVFTWVKPVLGMQSVNRRGPKRKDMAWLTPLSD